MSPSKERPRTLYDKIWDDHLVCTQDDGLALLYVDRHLLYEVTSPQAFDGLRSAGRIVRRPDCTLATLDHNVPTESRKGMAELKSYITEPNSLAQCLAMEKNAKEFGVTLFDLYSRRQGIVHVIGPENGFTLPGTVCVCGDSHSSTHGAFGCLAFGIGTSEVEHVLATQTLHQRKSKNMRINVEGTLLPGTTSKDLILHIIGVIGTAGGTGCVIEYTGPTIKQMSMEARMSVCNMSVEGGARAGMIAPDEVTFEYLRGRPLSPKGQAWEEAVAYWRTLSSDEGSQADVEVNISAADVSPTVSWGTSPQDVVPIFGKVPDPSAISDPFKRSTMERSLEYMGLTPNTPMEDIKVDKVFIGSCTNSRIEDLRSAAAVLHAAGPGARVSDGVQALIVPGSTLVKQHAEAEGLDLLFKRAGFDWREAGCSMCVGLNADSLKPGERCASTSNRNFEGRQGAGGRTHLMSPAMAVAAALNGKLTDVRKYSQAQGSVQISTQTIVSLVDPLSVHKEDIVMPTAPVASQRQSKASLTDSSVAMPDKTFIVVEGLAAPLHMENVDTDMIIPKQFCKTLKKTGLSEGLFYNVRVDPVTGERMKFVLDEEPYTKAKILVCTGRNFGCGSSREHAVWSIKDFGILCVVAPSFADIFSNNMMQNGMLPICLSVAECQQLAKDAEAGLPLRVDLRLQEIQRQNGNPPIPFTVNSFRRDCLLSGLDDIGITMRKAKFIDDFEERRSQSWPWIDGIQSNGRRPLPGEGANGLDW